MSITAGTLINGPLIIGDGVGGANTAGVRWDENNQVDNAVPISANSDGSLIFSDAIDTVGAVTVTGGLVSLGAGATGVMTMSSLDMTGGILSSGMAGSQYVLNGPVTCTSTNVAPARIHGNGALSLNGAIRVFTVNDGPKAIDTEFEVAITGTGLAAITKAGTGVLRLSGPANNTFTGTSLVREGLLELAHTGGSIAIAGPLLVGDGTGAAGSAVARLITSENIANTTQVGVASDGLFDVNDLTETIDLLSVNTTGVAQLGSGATGHLSVHGVLFSGGTLQTGAAGSSVLLTSNVTATGSAAAARITGADALDLNGATRQFVVANGPAAVDLQIDAQIIGAGGAGLVKGGAGVMLLTANNTFTGSVNVGDGTLVIDGNQPQTAIQVAAASATLGGTGVVGAAASPSAVPRWR